MVFLSGTYVIGIPCPCKPSWPESGTGNNSGFVKAEYHAISVRKDISMILCSSDMISAICLAQITSFE